MGFWSTVGKISKAVGKEVLTQGGEALDRSKQYTQQMPTKTDDELFRIIKKELRSSPMKTGAAKKELESRGYNHEEIMARLRQ